MSLDHLNLEGFKDVGGKKDDNERLFEDAQVCVLFECVFVHGGAGRYFTGLVRTFIFLKSHCGDSPSSWVKPACPHCKSLEIRAWIRMVGVPFVLILREINVKLTSPKVMETQMCVFV